MDAPPPWRCTLTALVWWRLLPARTPRLAVAALVRYSRTPVGAYSEVLAAVVRPTLGRPLVTVPFLAVDSAASREAGRESWALPKEVASFTGHARAVMSARTSSWSVRAAGSPVGPPVPSVLLARLEQPVPDGVLAASLSGRGWARPARVEADVSAGADLPEWFPAGRCWGASVGGVLVLGEPERR